MDHPSPSDLQIGYRPVRPRSPIEGTSVESLTNLILFLLGTFMDMAATILICTPIFLPIAMTYGMDPVQFGMVMLINCALGLNTPPVGTTQFVECAIGGISVGEVMRTILPFYAALIAALFLVTYVPAFSMWLPHLLLK